LVRMHLNVLEVSIHRHPDQIYLSDPTSGVTYPIGVHSVLTNLINRVNDMGETDEWTRSETMLLLGCLNLQ
jgi:hypothetical protein